MKTPLLASAIILTITLHASAQQTPPPTPPTPPPAPPHTSPQVIEILNRIETQSQSIKSLTATILHKKVNSFLGDEQTRTGKIHYLAAIAPPLPNPHPSKFAIHFTHLITNDGELTTLNHQHIFDGQWYVEKKADENQFLKKQIVGPNESLDPFSLDGNFPLPVAQKADDILKRFTVRLITPTPDTPDTPDAHLINNLPTIHLQLIPRQDATPATANQELQSIELWYHDAETLNPVQVQTIDRNDVVTTITLKNLTIDKITDEAAAKLFDTTPPTSGWDVNIDPL